MILYYQKNIHYQQFWKVNKVSFCIIVVTIKKRSHQNCLSQQNPVLLHWAITYCPLPQLTEAIKAEVYAARSLIKKPYVPSTWSLKWERNGRLRWTRSLWFHFELTLHCEPKNHCLFGQNVLSRLIRAIKSMEWNPLHGVQEEDAATVLHTMRRQSCLLGSPVLNRSVRWEFTHFFPITEQ